MIAPVPPLGARLRRALWALLAAGVLGRIVLAFATYGVAYDIDSLQIVGARLARDPLHVYDALRWPYPPGFFGFAFAAHEVSRASGLAFHGVVQIPAILADAGLAWTVQHGLGMFGRPARTRVVGAALVALGPSFVLISGFHGQIDAVAVLPALLALLVWRSGGARRALVAGALIGIGAAVKTVPLFAVLALLPTARSHRERGVLLVIAAAVPAVPLVPFLLASPHPTWFSLHANHGIPGFGGPGLLLQPSLADVWLEGAQNVGITHTTAILLAHQNLLVALGAVAAGALAWARRVEPVEASVLLWLTITVTNANPNFQYYIWLLPVLILAGRWRTAVVLQLVLAIPAGQVYFGWGSSAVGLYVVLLDAVWIGLVLVLAHEVWRVLGRPALRAPLVPRGS